MNFTTGKVSDVIMKPLQKYHDDRGWLCELFRVDDVPDEYQPVMSYLSITHPGVKRGPHEHVEQADYFCFLGPSDFELCLWDNRKTSPTFQVFQKEIVGAGNPMMVIIPAGVVHGYRNIGAEPGLVVNCPNRLYKGPGRTQPIDEIRHEDDPNSPFAM